MSDHNGNGHSTPAPEAVPAENLEKVRELLFGSQLRHQDQRFVQFQQQLAHELAAHREENRKRLDSLEHFFKGEVAALAEKLTAETQQRTDALAHTALEINASIAQVEKHVTQANHQAADAQRKLREELLAQSQTLRSELDAKQHEIMEIVEKAVGNLAANKTDRHALADMFAQLAGRLKEESSTPENNRMAAFH